MKRILIAFAFAASSALLFAQEAADKIRTITVDEAVILAADNNISQRYRQYTYGIIHPDFRCDFLMVGTL